MNLKKRYDQELVYVCSISNMQNEIANVIKCHGHYLIHPLIHSPCPFFLSFFPTQTYIGSILVSVNPYKLLNIYGTDMVLQYECRGLSDNPP